MTEPQELRIYPLELRELEVTGKPYRYLEGRAVPYNTWQDVGPFWENHAAGSFERSTKGGSGRGLPLIIGHDAHNLDNIVGHAEKWTHDATGMHGVWRLNEQPRAQQAAALAQAGDLTGLSVGFQEVHAEAVPRPKDRDGAATRKPWIMRSESRLLEVSLTPIPAFPDAGVVNVRSMVDPAAIDLPAPATPDLDEWRSRLEALRRATIRAS